MNPLKWKVWGAIGAGLLMLLGWLKLRGDHHQAKRQEAERVLKTTEKRFKHSEAVSEADRGASEKGAQAVKEAAEEAKTDDDWGRFRK